MILIIKCVRNIPNYSRPHTLKKKKKGLICKEYARDTDKEFKKGKNKSRYMQPRTI